MKYNLSFLEFWLGPHWGLTLLELQYKHRKTFDYKEWTLLRLHVHKRRILDLTFCNWAIIDG